MLRKQNDADHNTNPPEHYTPPGSHESLQCSQGVSVVLPSASLNVIVARVSSPCFVKDYTILWKKAQVG
jgi:hypothetical protein